MIVVVPLLPGFCLLWEAVKSGVWQFVRYFGPTDVVILVPPQSCPCEVVEGSFPNEMALPPLSRRCKGSLFDLGCQVISWGMRYYNKKV